MKPRQLIVLCVVIGLVMLLPGAALSAPTAQSGFSCVGVTGIPQTECEVLVVLYSSTDGPNWTNNEGWLDTATPCNWYGVTCSGGHVTRLELVENNLSGLIPSEIDNLSNLDRLWLARNALSGAIPVELGNLANLRRLNLQRNNLTGSVPGWLADIVTLQEIDLYGNQLTGNIPPNLGTLPDLEWLQLGDNPLTGNIPAELGNLPAIKEIHLGDCELSGMIPPELGNLTTLDSLYLQSNHFDGPIPATFGNMSSLRVLYLPDNHLSGSIPSELANAVSLEHIILSSNQLEGSIPPELASLTGLLHLELGENQLSGAIPPELGALTALRGLGLSGNQLDGRIPSELGDMVDLTRLSLHSNALVGEVPLALTNLVNLWDVNINYNKLTAADPTVAEFLDERNPGWANTQTVPPTNVQATPLSRTRIRVSWTWVAYQDQGYYEVSHATAPGGPYTTLGTTEDKYTDSYLVTNLLPSTTYYFTVRTFTPAHDEQQNDLLSWPSAEVSATTLAENSPPTVSVQASYVVFEGSTVQLEAQADDPDDDAIAIAWDLDGDGAFETPGQTVAFSAAGLPVPSSHVIMVQATDSEGASAIAETTVSVVWPLELIGQIGGMSPNNALGVSPEGDLVAMGVGARLQLFDISDPDQPIQLGSIALPGLVQAVAVSSDVAYVGMAPGLRVVDISDPLDPSEISYVTWYQQAHGALIDVVLREQYVYMLDGRGDLRIVDISDPSAPQSVGFYDTPAWGYSLAVGAGYAYVAHGRHGLRVLDVSAPSAPMEISWLDVVAEVILLDGNTLYVSGGGYNAGLAVVDASDPANLVQTATMDIYPGVHAYMADLALHGETLYVVNSHWVEANNRWESSAIIADVNDPAMPRAVGEYPTPFATSTWRIVGGYAYVLAPEAEADCGLWVLDVSDPLAPVRVGLSRTEAWKTTSWAADAPSASHVYVASREDGMRILDVSDGSHPLEVGVYDPDGYNVRSLAIEGGRAYLVMDDDYSFHVRAVDVSDPASPVLLGMQPTAWAGWIDVEDGWVYVLGEALHIIDMTSPSQPVDMGFLELDGLGGVTMLQVQGSYAYISDRMLGLTVIDVSDPASPTVIASVDLAYGAQWLAVQGDLAYIDTDYGMVYIFDITTPAAPTLVSVIETAAWAGEGGLAVQGDRLYVIHEFRGGLRAYDVSDPSTPQLVGWYDLLTSDWGVPIPYADASHIYVKSSMMGLLIFRPAGAEGEAVSEEVVAGGLVTTDTEVDGATMDDPLETSVTSPNAGTVSISESPVDGPSPLGYSLLGYQAEISAPTATPANPLVLVFQLDSSLIPPGQDESTVELFKDGVLVPSCTGDPSVASPDPCVSSRALLPDGDVQLTVLTSTASVWTFGVLNAGPISAPIDPVAVNAPIEVSALYHLPDTSGLLTATWDWDDGTTSTLATEQPSGTLVGSHTYQTAGVYGITLTLTDGGGIVVASAVSGYVVVYDPDGGFVTGGGWFMSPEGACQFDACEHTTTGKASFGFVSKYKKGANEPTGNTEFQFKAGNLNFHSDSYDWLVVAGANAKYKGVGTINGGGDYGFMLTATDAALTPSTEVDLFRIKIWDRTNGDEVVYDNKMGENDDSYGSTAIGGGNIKVHKG